MNRIQVIASLALILALGVLVSFATAQQQQNEDAGPVDARTQMHTPQGQQGQHGHGDHGAHGHGAHGQGMHGQQGQPGMMMQCPHCGMAMGKSKVTHAKAVLLPTEGNDTRGTVTFEQQGPVLVITAEVRGLEPGSTHGFHIHEYGDISAPDGTAAGGHYNPEDTPHALPDESERHAGDLGNITANDRGVATTTIEVRNASLMGMNPVLGRAVIVHAKEDTGAQPTGEAGARIAQGVIGVDAAPDTDED